MFEQAFKNVDDVLWKEAGCTTELDYTEQTSWLLFLKYLDGLEEDKVSEAALEGKKNMAAQLSDADRYEIPVAVILGEEELLQGEVAVKDLIAGKASREDIEDHDAYREAGRNTQVTIKREDMIAVIRHLLDKGEFPG